MTKRNVMINIQTTRFTVNRSLFGGNGTDLVQFQYGSGKMHRDNQFGPGRDGLFNGFRADHQCVAVTIHKNRLGSAKRSNIDHGDPSHRRCYNLIAGPQPDCPCQSLHHTCLTGHADDIGCAGKGFQVIFKLRPLRAGSDPARAQNITDGSYFRFGNGGFGKRQKCFSHTVKTFICIGKKAGLQRPAQTILLFYLSVNSPLSTACCRKKSSVSLTESSNSTSGFQSQ